MTRYLLEIIPGYDYNGIDMKSLIDCVAVLPNGDGTYRVTVVTTINSSIEERINELKNTDKASGLYYFLSDDDYEKVKSSRPELITIIEKVEIGKYLITNHPDLTKIYKPEKEKETVQDNNKILYMIDGGYEKINELMNYVLINGPKSLDIKKSINYYLENASLYRSKEKDGLVRLIDIPNSRGFGQLMTENHNPIYLDVTPIINFYPELFEKRFLFDAEYIKNNDTKKEGWKIVPLEKENVYKM